MYKLFLVCLFTRAFAFAQNSQGKSDDAARICLTSVVSEQIEGLTPTVRTNLENKLNQIASKNGMGASTLNDRFIITANVIVQSKDITPTAPPMHAFTLDITLYIGDGIDGTLFSNVNVSLKGVGETETKAYMNALKNLKVDDTKYQVFIETGKRRIIEYYNSKCDFIIKEAQMLSSQNQFDAAIYKLVSVPEVCKECYNKAMDAVTPIFQKQIDLECTKLMSKANGIWSSSQDQDGAKEAVSVLQDVNPQSKCFNETENMINFLFNEIKSRVKELDKRDFELRQKEQKDLVDIEKARINAVREIGVAFGNNQPKTITTYNYSGWW
jgi:hypothetical protein